MTLRPRDRAHVCGRTDESTADVRIDPRTNATGESTAPGAVDDEFNWLAAAGSVGPAI